MLLQTGHIRTTKFHHHHTISVHYTIFFFFSGHFRRYNVKLSIARNRISQIKPCCSTCRSKQIDWSFYFYFYPALLLDKTHWSDNFCDTTEQNLCLSHSLPPPSLSLCVCLCLSVFLCLSLSLFLSVCLCVCLLVSLCVSVSLRVSLCRYSDRKYPFQYV